MKSYEARNEVFETSDFWLAIFLKAKGSELVDIVWQGGKAIFSFKRSANIKELVREFYNGGLVPITSIKSNYDDLKSALYNFDKL